MATRVATLPGASNAEPAGTAVDTRVPANHAMAYRVIGMIALTSIVVGACVAAGWYYHLPGLHQWHAGFGTMGPHTAFCLILTGCSLALRRDGHGPGAMRAGWCLAAVVVAAATLTLGVSLLGLSLGLAHHPWTVAFLASFPGPMPVPTALVFLSLGLALLLIDVNVRNVAVAEVLASFGGLIAILALIAYAYAFVSFVSVAPRRPLAFHAVLLLLALSGGIFHARPLRGVARLALGGGVGGVVIRVFMPAAIAMPVLLGWTATELTRAGVIPPSLTAAYYSLATIVVFSLVAVFTAVLLERSEAGRRQAEQEVRTLNAHLQQRVEERTAELEALNKDLESFSYSVSHDLRAPLRHIAGFASILNERAGPALDDANRRHLDRITLAAQRMGHLIDDLLSFSRMGRAALNTRRVNLHELVLDARREVLAQPGPAASRVEWQIDAIPDVDGDPAMLRLVLLNLLANAVKYSSPREAARIEVGASVEPSPDGEVTVFVRDNGVGFDMRYVDKLFGVFQRLHRADEFEGTGIGLANVKRIISRHGGRVWAEGDVDRGSTFYFSLPRAKEGDDYRAAKDSAR